MMNKRIKKLWVKALRSGKYKQTTNKLYKGGAYCCLGVLASCQGIKPSRVSGYNYSDTSRDSNVLNQSFLDKVGLTNRQQRKLASLNDYGSDFNKIADYIEKNL